MEADVLDEKGHTKQHERLFYLTARLTDGQFFDNETKSVKSRVIALTSKPQPQPHVIQDNGRQVGLYVNRISDTGSSDSLGGFETITSDCGGECVKIEHVAMYVNDLEKARDFFVKYLNGKSNDLYHNKKTDFRSYFITFEDGARLEIMNKPDMVDAEKYLNRTGLIHIAFSVGSKERVDEITQLLQTDGYHIVSGPRTTGDGYYESCVVAIENNQIEFTV